MNDFPEAILRGKVYHKPKKRRYPYAWGANREAMRDASRSKQDYEGIDWDMRINLLGTPWGCHQPFPTKGDAWFDPRKKIGDRDHITTLNDRQMGRLRVRYQGANRPILTARQAATTCFGLKPRRLILCAEAKGLDKRFFDPEWWHEEFLMSLLPKTRKNVIVMTLPGGHGGMDGLRKMAAAHEVGLPTMWLWRGTPPKGLAQHVDLVKSRPGHPIYAI